MADKKYLDGDGVAQVWAAVKQHVADEIDSLEVGTDNIEDGSITGAKLSGSIMPITWVKGVISAAGTITDSNWVTSGIIDYPSRFVLSGSGNAVVRLYRGSEYLGKLNANDQLDYVAGNWKQFSAGTTDIAAILNTFQATSYQMSINIIDGTTVTPESAQSIGDARCTVYQSSLIPMSYLSMLASGANYVQGTDFIKRPIKTELLGTLTQLQAFCVYNQKYYSINGSYISVQDANFTNETTLALSVGHGNSFQLGNNGIAYASGWNDNTVYAVNLDTLTIVNTYSLPTSYYTTVAVDDVNGIMYIFQRDSVPDTVAMYNFITYDYVNQQVLSTRKVKAFAAMQSCDYYEGRIIVAYGVGTSAAPSGMFVCNTAGDILAEYELGIFATSEPEGVFFDRNSGELLVSKLTTNVGNQVYKVENV